MDGQTLLYRLRTLLSESSTSDYMEDRASYEYLHDSATTFVRETGCITATKAITTVDGTSAYDLGTDFLMLYLLNDFNQHYIKVYNGASYYFVTERDYDAIVYANRTDEAAIPDNFAIRDKQSSETRISSTATSTAASSNGEALLTDTASDFSSVEVGDAVHNITDGSHGYVTATNAATSVYVALFDGTANDWTSGDSYILIPQARKQLVLTPPSSTSGYTVTVEYIQRPIPVYSPYRSYRIPDQYTGAIVMYAAWLYKYRDMQPNFGDPWYKHWDLEVRKAKGTERRIKNKYSVKVNFTKTSMRDRSLR